MQISCCNDKLIKSSKPQTHHSTRYHTFIQYYSKQQALEDTLRTHAYHTTGTLGAFTPDILEFAHQHYQSSDGNRKHTIRLAITPSFDLTQNSKPYMHNDTLRTDPPTDKHITGN